MKKITKLITLSTFVIALFMITSCEREGITTEIQEIEAISKSPVDSKIAPSSQEVVLRYMGRRGSSKLSARVINGNELEVQRVAPRPRNDATEAFFVRKIIVNGRTIRNNRSGRTVTSSFFLEGPRYNRTSIIKRTLSNIRYTDGTPVGQINSFEVVVTYSLANPGFGGPRRWLVFRTNVPLRSN